MAQLSTHLGYGKTGIIELDIFTRMLREEIYDYEEVRLVQPSYGAYWNTFSYMGLAIAGSPIDQPVWNVIRKTIDGGGRTSRIQFRENIKWTEYALGWS